ncbi:filamentous hemagglutinin N-terminal domain-containing protein [Nostoc sp. S13]|uniref:two-partner secretion domain-containing protein n=1 Tax=Nostoc sp. S13 TaxID=3019266 RepID=UPI00262F884E|nr:filamentous hemagglutinin N-terminal domain-containing protein [Nostoc sp. S13]MDF5740017.1 filamentous hemagglutinin N-terminal domain-containing protein [Nostoc sp. S13]
MDGLIRTQSGVNLFLLNPSGIIFGQNARLDVGGSFVGSTANALQFGNIGFFSATNKNIPSALLTINPSALFFNQINAAPIVNNSIAPAGRDPSRFNTFSLRVADGQSLLLVGGDININNGRLNAFGGRVELGGLAGQGTVGLNVDDKNLSLSFPDGVTRADVSLTNAAQVNVRAGNSGGIKISARNLNLLTGSTLRAGIGFNLGAVDGTNKAGDIEVNATESVKIQDGSFISNAVFGIGDGGNINIKAGSFTLADEAFVVTSTFGDGSAGNITLQASGQVAFTNGSYIATSGVGLGNAGDVKISTAGNVIFDAQKSFPPNITGIFSQVEPFSRTAHQFS